MRVTISQRFAPAVLIKCSDSRQWEKGNKMVAFPHMQRRADILPHDCPEGDIQDQAGWSSETPILAVDVPVHFRGVEPVGF